MELSRSVLERDGQVTVNHELYAVHPMEDWWEGWRFGSPPPGLMKALSDPEIVERINRRLESEEKNKLAEIRYTDAN